MRALVWFREDLRVSDNSALFHACKNASRGVQAVYFITPDFWQKHAMAETRIAFLLEGVQKLSEELRPLNISLKVVELKTSKELPSKLLELAQGWEIDALYFNHQYEVNELARDETVCNLFEQQQIPCYRFDDMVIFSPLAIVNQAGGPFKVFTPFKKAWLKHAAIHSVPAPYGTPKQQSEMIEPSSPFEVQMERPKPLDYWPTGEKAALNRLEHFIEHKISAYKEKRDYPALDYTSRISPYLSTGMISSRQCFYAALEFNHFQLEHGNAGALCWMSELIWREFYKMILVAFPHVSKHKAFKPETDLLQWDYNDEFFQAWCQGQTGYPLVDAAMRQLKEMAWMHNRLRMVVAMFLSKTLFLNWQLGERYFIEHLIDGDLAANNGGWQWSASTGVDAAPYFRIFNPSLQSERFDSNGDFIRRYCPELAHLDKTSIHQPWQHQGLFSQKLDYPKPMVKHDVAKARVIAAFKGLGRETI